MSWWEYAYRGGAVQWDPGPYDRHLARIVERFRIEPGPALDIGCGTGKSVIWLAGRGFTAHGIDLAPSAIEQARRAADAAGVQATFAAGSFPEEVGPGRALPLADGSLLLAVERATLQHIGGHGAAAVPIDAVARLLRPGGWFYSLSIAAEGMPRSWGMARWDEPSLRALVAPWFDVVHIERTVFTPGEPGSLPAWLALMRRGDGAP